MFCLLLSALLVFKVILNIFVPNNYFARLFAWGMTGRRDSLDDKVRHFDTIISCIGALTLLVFYFTHNIFLLCLGTLVIILAIIIPRFFLL